MTRSMDLIRLGILDIHEMYDEKGRVGFLKINGDGGLVLNRESFML